MTNFVALLRRELGVYFVSPMAYIVLSAFLFLCGAIFVIMVVLADASREPLDYAGFLRVVTYLLALFSPLITMRLIAEEKHRGTIETMMTAPVSEWQFVLSKFCSSFLFIAYLLLPTVCYLILAAKYGTVDGGAAASGYVGTLLALGAVLALGVCISALSANQIIAGVLTLAAVLGLMFTGAFAYVLGILLPPGDAVGQLARDVLVHVSLLGHMESFGRGIVDTRALVYLLSVTYLFLFLTVRVVESRRWR